MLTFLEIITIFYPSYNLEDQKILGVKLDEETGEFYTESWKKIEQSGLVDQTIQLRLLRTLYQLQFGYYDGVGTEILRSLERWSGGSLVFDFLSPAENEFYQKLYTLIGFRCFEYVAPTTQLLLLGTRMLPLALFLKVPIYKDVERHFASTCDIEYLKADSVVMSGAIENNSTKVGMGKSAKMISEWIKEFNKFKEKNRPNAIEEYIKKISTSEKDPELQEVLGEIIQLYQALITNDIWQNITYSLCIHQERGRDSSFFPDDYYLHVLKQLPNISSWLQDHSEVALWFSKKPENTVKKLFSVLKEKIDLNNEEQLGLVMQLIDDLKEKKIKDIDQVLFFNEEDGEFRWNEDLLKQPIKTA